MRTISYKLDDLKKVVIPIGYEGENNHTRVIIDAGEVFKQYPAAVATLKVKPPHGTIYPVVVRREGDTVIWDVKETDCASNGTGEAQFTFTENSVIVKNDVTKININRSLVATGPAPDPIEDWLDEATEVLDDLGAMDNIAKNAKASDIGKSLSPKTVVDGVVTEWQYVEQSGGTEDYTDLDNKPSIAGVTLSGNKTLEDLGIAAADDLDNLADDVTDVKNAIQGLDDDKYEKPSGGIPATDLTQAVQNSLSAADSAYQKPSGGIPASDIADGVIPVVDSALSDSSENAVQNKVVKGALDGKAPVIINTATGNPAVFSDGADGLPIQSLKVHLLPQQEGTGDPSPQNIRPILPWDGLKVFGGGKNLLNLNRTEGTPNPTTTLVSPRVMDTDHFYIGLHDANYYVKAYASGSVQDGVVNVTSINNNSYGIGFPVAIKGGAKYTINCNAGSVLIGISYYDAEWNFISSGGDIYKSQIPATRTTPDNASYMVIIFRSSVGEEYTYSDVQLSAGQTATAYEEYHPITETDISFPSPVYGGEHEAVSGKLMNAYIMRTFHWSDGQNPNDRGDVTRKQFSLNADVADANPYDLCNVAKYKVDYYSNDVHFYVNGTNKVAFVFLPNDTPEETEITVVAKLATPQEIQLTPQQITALVGNNTIWSDADGSMTIEYPADTKTYINNLIATAIASL